MERILVACVYLLVGVLSFMGTRSLGATAVAQGGPRWSREDVMQLLKEDRTRPVFEGAINGITFRERVGSSDLTCESGSLTYGDSAPEGFALTYLPIQAKLVHEVVALCEGRTVMVSKTYRSSSGSFEVVWFAGDTVASVDPLARMQKSEIDGNPAVIIRALPTPGTPKDLDVEQFRSWRLVVLTGTGVIDVRSNGITLAEGRKIVKGVEQ